ncbi:glycosyltransferase [Mongoliimonas terrestris]|uniref:glycosyltransferase n=1 Tax=Mongoliimonas terrestris TaxID=1709001 RepID=UPI00094978F4|nr:glycosyltransferase [Mongoliimonas terrestris]
MSQRILHVCETVPGGPASYLRELLPLQFSRFGRANIALVMPAEHAQYIGDVPLEHVYLWTRRGRDVPSFLSLARRLWSAIVTFRPDVVHIHSTYAGVIGRIVCAIHPHRCVVVYCSHGWSFSMDASALHRAGFKLIERTLSAVTDGIVNISDFEARLAAEAGIPIRMQRTILNGINDLREPDPGRKSTGYPIRLLFVGRHDPQKGLDILLDAMRRVAGGRVTLDVVGGAQVSASRFEVDGKSPVHFTGWLDREEVFRRIAAADAVVMPSRWEGFGLVAIEAFRAGVPVLASKRGALPEIVTDGDTGYLFEPDPESLLACIGRLDKSDLIRMGHNARAVFLQKYTARRMSFELGDFYAELTAKRRFKPVNVETEKV